MAEGRDPRRSVYAALVADALITLSKFVAALMSGSTAMLAESLHSLADTGNQAFLLLGLRRAARPADEEHPFGHGQERFFWAFLVSISLFMLGAAFSIYEGVSRLVGGHNQHLDPVLALIVLALSAVFEGYALRTAWRQFEMRRGRQSLWAALRGSKDPEILTVIGEDTAAIAGLTLAMAGIVLSWLTGDPAFDAIASILIGAVLGVVAFLLGRESQALLLGESASREVNARIRRAVESSPRVDEVVSLRTMHLGPQEILVGLEAALTDELTTDGVERTIDELEHAIRDEVPEATSIFIEPEMRHPRTRR